MDCDEEPADLHPAEQPPVDRFCDVVMKGGVTDGLVYPWAIMALARQYRFQSIGGTSIGAVAAALTAACEFGRRKGSVRGFNKVMKPLPQDLAETLTPSGDTKLFSLFQPAPGAERLFRLFVGIFSAQKDSQFRAGLGLIFKEYVSTGDAPLARLARACTVVAPVALLPLLSLLPLLPFLTILLVAGGGVYAEAVAAVVLAVVLTMSTALLLMLLAVMGAAFFIAFGLVRDVRNALGSDGFGLCTGMGQPGAEGLVDWLHRGIQAAAGKTLDDPLTFKHLWDAPGGPRYAPRPGVSEPPPSIDLRMMASNLTQGRPYGFPLTEDSGALYFRMEDLAPFFPSEVMTYLKKCAVPHADFPTYLRMPKGDLPILVATRLSLSVPLLFKSIGLWAIPVPAPGVAPGAPYRCWFSDGGICANFPIQLFDEALPRWPTFGVTLEDHPPKPGQDPKLPWITDAKENQPELDYSANTSNKPAQPSIKTLLGFLYGIVDTARKWNDNASVRLPGVRERVVHIYLDPKKASGGLNLRITGDRMMELAVNGHEAGLALVRKFLHPAVESQVSHGHGIAWDEHRWVRFTTLVHSVRSKLDSFSTSARDSQHATGLRQAISDASATSRKAPYDNGFGLTANQAEALVAAQAALATLEQSFAKDRVQQPQPLRPRPELRTRAPW